MIRTTMEHKVGSNPGSLPHGRIVGQPTSKNVIRTTVSKPSCKADNFINSKQGNVEFRGGNAKDLFKMPMSKGKQA